MKTQDATQRAGSATALAELLGITPSAISQWGVEVPQPRVWQLRVLRPDWFVADIPTSQSEGDASAGRREGEHATANADPELERAYVELVKDGLVKDRRVFIRRRVDRDAADKHGRAS